jgi:hypothetical protein
VGLNRSGSELQVEGMPPAHDEQTAALPRERKRKRRGNVSQGVARMTMTMRSRVTTSISKFRALFSVRTDSPELAQAQIKALSKQLPLLFFIGLVNTLAVAWTHYGKIPSRRLHDGL